MYLIYSLLCTTLIVKAEVISLIKGKRIVCVATDGDVNSSVYVRPPVKTSKVGQDVVFLQTGERKSEFLGRVLDERWEDFEILNSNVLKLKLKPKTNHGFSYCGKNDIKILNNTDFWKDNAEHQTPLCEKWQHYYISTNGKSNNAYNVILSGDDNTIISVTEGLHIKLASETPSLWKLHKISFVEIKMYNSTFHSPHSGNLSLSMFVKAINETADVTLQSNNATLNVHITPQKWRKIKIDITSRNSVSFSLTSNATVGIGAVKISPRNTRTYSAKLHDPNGGKRNFTCELLEEKQGKAASASKPCPCGYLGSRCDLTCANVLGRRHRFCENFTICDDRGCGKKCDQPPPELPEAPEVAEIGSGSVSIRMKSEYGTGRKSPDNYLMQHRQEQTRNLTIPYESFNISQKDVISNLTDKLVNNEFSIVSGSIKATKISNEQILLEWFNYRFPFDFSYELAYQCRQECDDAEEKFEGANNTKDHNFSIDNLPSLARCSIKLYRVRENKQSERVLLDALNVTTTEIKDLSGSKVLPVNITAETDGITAHFETCNHFQQPLNYTFQWTCISKWCRNHTGNINSLPKKAYRRSEIFSVDLLPYTEYNMTVIADLLNTDSRRSYRIRTPPKQPFQVQRLTTRRNITHIVIKWLDPHPPTGDIEAYYIEYTKGNVRENATVGRKICEEEFICAEIQHYDQEVCTITVWAKNANVSEYGTPASQTLNECSPALQILRCALIILSAIILALMFYLILAFWFKIFPFNLYRNGRIISQRTEKRDIMDFSQHYRANSVKVIRSKADPPPEEEMLITKRKKYSSDESRPIELSNFESYLMESLGDNPYNNILTKQYKRLQSVSDKPATVGLLSKNIEKNRYRNLAAFDETRVILKENNGNDYINANYIEGYDTKRAFIAAQAPLKTTLLDFWTMIWQENVTNIFMLTELVETGLVKCEQYWPDVNRKVRYGEILIENVSEKIFSDYVHRQLRVDSRSGQRLINHFQYVTWPDHGVPLYPQNFTQFTKNLLKLPQHNSPILVHCTAGCGRTGTLILCDIVLRTAAKEGRIDFVGTLLKLKEQRNGLVNNANQYVFAHFVVRECLFGKDFSIPIDDNFQDEIFKRLRRTSVKPVMEHLDRAMALFKKQQVKYSYSLSDEDQAKNRCRHILPGHAQVHLKSNWEVYINAVSVDCYRCPRKFIVTQQPLRNTLEDFWSLIKEYEINTIVSLNDEHDPDCPQFWSCESASTRLEVIDEIEERVYVNTKLRVTSATSNKCEKIVNILRMKNWKRTFPSPPSPKELIIVLKEMFNNSWKGNSQIVITCYDGALASGLFVALAYLLEKMNYEQSCDVFSAVRTVRQSREEFVQEWGQIEFLYKAAKVYIEEFDNYDNFNG